MNRILVVEDNANLAFGLTGKHVLYGRRNTLSNPEGHPLAELVEILPPAAKT